MSGHGQLALPFALGDKSSFDNFWVGHNLEAVAAVKSCVTADQANVIYLYGAEGAGKSHILFAAARMASDQNKICSYLSLTDPQFRHPDKATALLEMVNVANIVCVDNVEGWAGESERERALFALFEQIRHARGRLIVAGRRAPENLGLKLVDLISRLSSGLVYPIQGLGDEQFFEALKLRASARGLTIADDVVKYLISRSTRSAVELFELLDSIDKASLIEKRRITIPFLQQFLKSH